jgi:hypothetical protein
MDGEVNPEVARTWPFRPLFVRILRRSQPASSAEASSAALGRRSTHSVGSSGWSGALLQSKYRRSTRSADPAPEQPSEWLPEPRQRTRLRPAFCSCITPSEAFTTRQVRWPRRIPGWPDCRQEPKPDRDRRSSPACSCVVSRAAGAHAVSWRRIRVRSSLGLIAAMPR